MQTTIDFQKARQKGHDAGDACARKAGSEWVEQAVEIVRVYAAYSHPIRFTMDELRTSLTTFRTPPDARAWGTVTRLAVARGIIARTGGYRAAVSSNGSVKPVYRKA